MIELYRHIGPSVDVPAGDIGVGGREIAICSASISAFAALTRTASSSARPSATAASIRPEATGFGAIYYVCEVLKHEHDTIEGKTIIMSGFGNAAWASPPRPPSWAQGRYFPAPTATATILTASAPRKSWTICWRCASGRNRAQDYADKFRRKKFVPGKKSWEVKGDICMPAAYQNEIGMPEVEQILANGTK